MNGSIPIVTLADVLTKSDAWVEIKPDQRYRQVTVKLWGKGVVQRDEVSGTEIAAPRRLVVRAQQFILSRIDARNGAFGIVPQDLDGAVVSNDFPVFTPAYERLLPDYLGWMSRTKDFAEICRAASEGTTNRIRLNESRFLTTKIPLPSLDEQRRVVARIEELAAKIEEVQGLRREAAEESEAGSKSVMRQVFGTISTTSKVTLESVCTAIIDNLHSNPVYSAEGTPCIRSPDVGWGILYLERALKTDEEEYIRRTVRGEPQPNDIVLVREGGGTGKAALVKEGQRLSLGQRVMMLRPDLRLVDPHFMLYQILSPLVNEDQVVPLSKGSASPHLNIGSLRQFTFSLPPLAEQRRIVAYLDELQGKMDALKRLQAETQAELDALLPAILDRAFKGELG